MPNPIPTRSREIVKTRDVGRCVRCGMAGNNFHHRRSRSVTDDCTHAPCNAITLCGSGTTGCHGWVHAHPFEARAMGWIVSRHATPHDEPVHVRWLDWITLTCEGAFHLHREESASD